MNLPNLPYEGDKTSDGQKPDRILAAIMQTATSSTDFVGVCVIEQTAHGYSSQQEWIQLQDGGFLTRSWDDLHNETTASHSVRLNLDLREELKKLRQEGFNLRSSNNKNADVKTGKEGRFIRLYLSVQQDGEWLSCPGPLIDGTYENNSVNRIFDVTTEGRLGIKLV